VTALIELQARLDAVLVVAAELKAENEGLKDAGWAIHNSAREQGGSLTVIGTDTYLEMLKALNGSATSRSKDNE